jgi:hypothetical protein
MKKDSLAGRGEPPQHDEELARQRDNHRLARSASRVRRSPSLPRAEWAAYLVHQMTPGEFDHPAAHAGVACFGEASLASSLAALIWSSCEAGIARQSPTRAARPLARRARGGGRFLRLVLH